MADQETATHRTARKRVPKAHAPSRRNLQTAYRRLQDVRESSPQELLLHLLRQRMRHRTQVTLWALGGAFHIIAAVLVGGFIGMMLWELWEYFVK
jgi:uncharacterized damage-inducible protein DinB